MATGSAVSLANVIYSITHNLIVSSPENQQLYVTETSVSSESDSLDGQTFRRPPEVDGVSADR